MLKTPRHPNLVAVSEIAEFNGHPVVVADYIEGPTLAAMMAKDPPTLEESDLLVRKLLTGALAASKAGLRHHNLHPGNIRLAGNRPIIMDFGLYPAIRDRIDDLRGKAAYRAPEPPGTSGQGADVFSLAAILYEILLHQPAFSGVDAAEVAERIKGGDFIQPQARSPRMPVRMARAIEHGLNPDPKQRTGDAATLLAEWRGQRQGGVWDAAILGKAEAIVASPNRSHQFPGTRWSMVMAAGSGGQEALARLCADYWYPLYSYVRRRGFDPARAQDLTQSFFARLLHRGDVAKADRQRGKFRTYLLSSLHNFIINEEEREGALKRGGGKVVLSLDYQDAEGRYCVEAVDHLNAEKLFERNWTLTLLRRVRNKLGQDYASSGRSQIFERLKGCLTTDGMDGTYAEAGKDLGISAGAAKVAVHRIKKRYQALLREEVLQTVSDPSDVDDELQYLFSTL
ncbi:MAG: protein kinase [Proteobacteria bacterium]|nr:protein kinase [Pseudomonadota bacterium]